MVKLPKYSLSLLLVIVTFFSCDINDLNRLNPSKKEAMTNRLNATRGAYFQGSRTKDAMYDTLIMLNPQEASYYRGKSVGHSKIGDYHIAFPLLEKAAELNPSETLYYYAWLLVYLYRDYERALVRLQEYDDLTPGRLDVAWGENVNYLKGLAHKQLGQYESAITEFNQAIAYEGEDKVDLYTFVYRGIAYQKMGAHNQAIQDFDRAISLYDKCTMAYYYKAISLAAMDKKKAARENFMTARSWLEKGYKKTDPYKEVYDEVFLEMVDDQLLILGDYYIVK